jgi:hypothetical protein
VEEHAEGAKEEPLSGVGGIHACAGSLVWVIS